MAECWSIVESAFSADSAQAYEGLFTLGSGYMHVRGSFEEHLLGSPQDTTYERRPANVTAEEFPASRSKWGTYVPGIFGRHPWLGREMINLPFFLGLTPFIDGEKLDMEASRIHRYRRELLLRTAVLRRSLQWIARGGETVEVTFERFVSAARPGLCVQRASFAASSHVPITIRAGIDAEVRTNGFDHFTHVCMAQAGCDRLECRITTDGGDDVHIVSAVTAPDASWSYEERGRRGELVADFVITSDRPLVVEKRTAIGASRDLHPADSRIVLAGAMRLPYEALLEEHSAVWEERWKRADVVIEGDPVSQLALRSSVYHLLRCHVPGDSRVGIDPKGYAGDAYCGRYFWDSEMYLLPFYLYTSPESAKTLVDFRVRTLPGARANAARYGYSGARYPWESDGNGNEHCPSANWQYRDHQVHVTADVVYGIAHYASATGDWGYLEGPAAQVIADTARYWMERLDWRIGDDYPSLLGVMGPDEYTPISSNNAYTNRMVSFALNLASKVGMYGAVGVLGGVTESECRAFAQAAAGLPVLRDESGLVIQCEDFDRLAEPDFGRLWLDRTEPFASQVSQERLYRSKCIKQADVILLMALFPDEFTQAEVRRSWDYYVPYTTHDSSLSAGAHALVAIRLGLTEEAWGFWKLTSQIDLDVEGGRGASEGIHIAAAGAAWQVAVFGFGGVATAMQSNVLSVCPRLPVNWSRLAFPLMWHGSPVLIDISPAECTISNRGHRELEVCIDQQRCFVPAGGSVFAKGRQLTVR